jgi:hypothetical protein
VIEGNTVAGKVIIKENRMPYLLHLFGTPRCFVVSQNFQKFSKDYPNAKLGSGHWWANP